MKNRIFYFSLFIGLSIFAFTACDDTDDPIVDENVEWTPKDGIFTLSADPDVMNASPDLATMAIEAEAFWQASFQAEGNTVANPGLSIDLASEFNPVPANNVGGNLASYPSGDSFFSAVNYKGAFGTFNWGKEWTLFGETYMGGAGYTTNLEGKPEKVIIDDGNGTGTVTWENDTVYVLENMVFVNSGQTLTIEAGTVIKGKAGTGEDASALIVARGGKIMAEGTEQEPVIFTSVDDDLSGSVAVDERGKWGGLIVLGKARLNSTPGESAIEGIPTSEARGLYGGDDDSDNSGVIKYVSLRHGGSDIGEGNEINGLTLGGVGSGTTIDYIEVISNKDDGIEWFGGTARVKHAMVALCGDDSFDYDEGWRGKGQFWFGLQDPENGDRMGEHDGGTDPEDGQPYAQPTIYNVTYVGRGAGHGKRILTFRDNAGGVYANSIFLNQANGIDVELLESGQCSYNRVLDGQLVIKNNIFYNVAE